MSKAIPGTTEARHGRWRSRRAVAAEVLGYLMCVGVGVELALRLADSLAHGFQGRALLASVQVLVAAVLGMLAADFMVGLTHFLADNIGDERTPLFGPTLIRTFREHHAVPSKIVQHGFIETNAAAGLGLLPVLLLFRGALLVVPSAFGYALLLAFAVSVLAANQVHKWAHAAAAPGAIRYLQRLRIILNPADHAQHHLSPHNTRYCIVFGWLNGPLDRCRFFERVRTALTRNG